MVGYKVRFTDNLAPGASVKLMTDGILLAETQTDPLLKAYDTLIIDEAHERSLNIDFLLGYLKEILPRRPDLKLIVTSATIDADRFARHFGTDERPAPVIEVSGRLYPVEMRYRPVAEDRPAVKHAEGTGGRDRVKTAREAERDLMDAIVDAVDELCREAPATCWCSCPASARSAKRPRRCASTIRRTPRSCRCSRGSRRPYKVFKASNARRIVLATNVAETSLTVPGIRYVVDTGLARVAIRTGTRSSNCRSSRSRRPPRTSARAVAAAWPTASASACTRKRLKARARFTDPEILRSSLASVILRMKSLHLTAIESFPFLEPPPGRAIADGYQLLNEPARSTTTMR